MDPSKEGQVSCEFCWRFDDQATAPGHIIYRKNEPAGITPGGRYLQFPAKELDRTPPLEGPIVKVRKRRRNLSVRRAAHKNSSHH